MVRVLQDLQDEPRFDIMETLWEGVWKAIEDPTPDIQALGLRYINRWKWENLTRVLQLDGLGRVKDHILHCSNPPNFQLSLLLTYGWMAAEWKRPDWPSYNGVLRSLILLEHQGTEAFPDQKKKVGLTLQGLWFPEAFEELLRRSTADSAENAGAMETWSVLGPRAGNFLLEKALAADEGPGANTPVFGILERLEFAGQDVLLAALGTTGKPARLEGILKLFEHLIMTRGVAGRIRGVWDALSAAERETALEVAARWRRREFRDVALQRIASSSPTEALHALRLFPALAQEGDTRELLQIAEARDFDGRSTKDVFLVETCVALGRLTEAFAITELEEWVQAKGILDRLRDKSDVVKRAALQALGQYKSQQVRLFLERYSEHGDRDLRKDALEALHSVTERLSEG